MWELWTVPWDWENLLTFKSEISELVQAGLTRTATTKSTRLRRSLVSTVDVVEVEKEDISSEDWRWTWDFQHWLECSTTFFVLVTMLYTNTNIFNWCGEIAARCCHCLLSKRKTIPCQRDCRGNHFGNLVQSFVQSFLYFQQSLWKITCWTLHSFYL